MKIFISWSGERSRLVAELLNSWVKCVIQASKPWISTQDIESGSTWFNEISNELNDASVGVICLTQENKNNPWILFESGALAKGLDMPRVCTFLIDLEHIDVRPPLAQFNHTLPNRESVWKLVRMINSRMDSACMEPEVLTKVFDTYWPQFESDFNEVLEQTDNTQPEPVRSNDEMLGELLEMTRSLSRRINNLEHPRRTINSRPISERVIPPGKRLEIENSLMSLNEKERERMINSLVQAETLGLTDEQKKLITNSLQQNLVQAAFIGRANKSHNETDE